MVPTVISSILMIMGLSLAQATTFRFDGTLCGDFPRVPVGTMPGSCLGLAYQGEPLKLPRRIVQIPGRNEFVVGDVGNFTHPYEGRLHWLRWQEGQAVVTELVDLPWPHGLQIGPEGWVYVGIAGGIVRFDPHRLPDVHLEMVIPRPDRQGGSMHPFTHFIFGQGPRDQWDIYLNVGSPSDACEGDVADDGRCREAEDESAASIWHFRYLGAGMWNKDGEVYARGLRNSMGLVSLPSGRLLQADNARNLKSGVIDDPHEPYDELNLVEQGRHYGWPYCMNFRAQSPEWEGVPGWDCSLFSEPWGLLPPHSAPLDAIYFRGILFPELAGSVLISLRGPSHGSGHRLISLPLDSDDRPRLRSGEPGFSFTHNRGETSWLTHSPLGGSPRQLQIDEVIGRDWYGIRDVRPRGGSVGLWEDDRGRLWIVNDRHAILYVLDRGETFSLPPDWRSPSVTPEEEAIRNDPDLWRLWQAVDEPVFQKHCADCHAVGLSDLLTNDAWMDWQDPRKSMFFRKMEGEAGTIMPPAGRLEDPDLDLVRQWLDSLKGLSHLR